MFNINNATNATHTVNFITVALNNAIASAAMYRSESRFNTFVHTNNNCIRVSSTNAAFAKHIVATTLTQLEISYTNAALFDAYDEYSFSFNYNDVQVHMLIDLM